MLIIWLPQIKNLTQCQITQLVKSFVIKDWNLPTLGKGILRERGRPPLLCSLGQWTRKKKKKIFCSCNANIWYDYGAFLWWNACMIKRASKGVFKRVGEPVGLCMNQSWSWTALWEWNFWGKWFPTIIANSQWSYRQCVRCVIR